MADEPRRSRRRAYVSLQALQERARAAAPADEHDALWGEEGMNDDDDESFNEDIVSDTGEVRSLLREIKMNTENKQNLTTLPEKKIY